MSNQQNNNQANSGNSKDANAKVGNNIHKDEPEARSSSAKNPYATANRQNNASSNNAGNRSDS